VRWTIVSIALIALGYWLIRQSKRPKRHRPVPSVVVVPVTVEIHLPAPAPAVFTVTDRDMEWLAQQHDGK
jgi:hypothetical protein